VLEVGDLDRSVEFYGEVLALTEVERWSEPRPGAWFSIGRNAVLGLWPPQSGGPGVGIAGARGGTHVHFAIYVEPGTLPSWKSRLERAGHRVEGPATFGHGNKSLFTEDPDGNVVELGDWTVDWAGDRVAGEDEVSLGPGPGARPARA
jgi:catechol 2,3-dioxygenase-like lactoylglutathione lyase family enzyme